MEQLLEFGQIISKWAGILITVSGATTLLVKPIRQRFIGWIMKTSKSNETQTKLGELTDVMKSHVKKDAIKQEEIEAQKKEISLLKEAIKCQLRNDITLNYYKYLKDRRMPVYVYEDTSKMIDSYFALHGNTYVQTIWDEMKVWEKY